MALKNSSSYAWPAQLLHWSVAALIVTQFVLGNLAERAEDNDAKMAQLTLLSNHKSVGITILMLALLRVVWRLLSPPPALPSTMPGWQVLASKFSHRLLYVLIFVLPITGWLMSSASAYTVSWFNLFELPDLVAPSTELKETLLDAHHLFAELLFVLAVLHIAAALKHHFVDKDDILRRMMSSVSLSVFAVLLSATLWSFATIDTNRATDTAVAAPDNVPAAQQESLQTAAVERDSNSDGSDLPAWNIDYAASSIEFTAEQAGANFTGVWPSWRAGMFFTEKSLPQSSFDVQVDVTKVSSRDEERDTTLMEPEWFHAEKFPEATFVTREFKKNPDGSFTAMATLSIKGLGTPVEFDFTVEDSAEKVVLNGSARLDRLALKVGTGEWTDLEWIGQYVDVKVHVEAILSE
ncbi:MAG: cytochrome b/b6 domain-containing protein [Pseudomonadales bacterium]